MFANSNTVLYCSFCKITEKNICIDFLGLPVDCRWILFSTSERVRLIAGLELSNTPCMRGFSRESVACEDDDVFDFHAIKTQD
jgi:hypothetical protein